MPTAVPRRKPGSARARLAATWGQSSPERSAWTKCPATSAGLRTKSGSPVIQRSCQSATAPASARGPTSRRDSAIGLPRGRPQEVEIASLRGLEDALDEEAAVAPREAGGRRAPRGPPPGQLGLG